MSHPPARSVESLRAVVRPGPWGAFLLYALLTVALTWPLAIHLVDRLPGGDNDLWQSYWNHWWWKLCLEEGRSPYKTDMMYQPGETSLAFHTHSEANVIATLPLNLLFGATFAYNAGIFLGFLLAAQGCYLLARETLGSTRGAANAAFLAGIVGSFFPHHFDQSLEHINLASLQGIPLFAWALLRLGRRGGAANVLLLAAMFALNSLYSWHNGLSVLPLGCVLTASLLRRPHRPRAAFVRDLCLSGASAATLLLPFLWPMLRELLAGATYYLKPPVSKGIDALFLAVPSADHTLWGRLFEKAYARLATYPSAGFTAYLGAPAVVLAIAALLPRKAPLPTPASSGPRPSTWAVILSIYLILALGATLTLAGWDTGLPLPFALLRSLPVLGALRVANRFVVPAMVALSVLSAVGATRLQTRCPRLLAGNRAWALVAIVVLDSLWIPYPLRELPSVPWAAAVRSAPEGPLLDIPSGHRARGARDLYYQTAHGRPLVGGYASCVPPEMESRVERLGGLEVIFEGRPRGSTAPEAITRGLEEVLSALRPGVVVLHRDRSRERLATRQAQRPARAHGDDFNPEKGAPEAVLAVWRSTLQARWGEPSWSDGETEVYYRPPGD